jgi:thioredoxin 1
MEILTDANFEEFISKSDKPVLLDVFATWCPPCKMLGPVLDKLSEEYADKVAFTKMDLDQNPETGNKFGVEVIPTVFLFKNGEVVDKFVGYKPEEDVKTWLNSLLS